MGRRANQQRTVLIALAAVAVGLMVVCGAGGAYVGLALWLRPATAPAKTYERDELRKAVMGKTQDEVMGLLGKPDHTGDTGGNTSWMYMGVSYDRTNGRPDSAAHLYFRNGRVAEVRF